MSLQMAKFCSFLWMSSIPSHSIILNTKYLWTKYSVKGPRTLTDSRLCKVQAHLTWARASQTWLWVWKKKKMGNFFFIFLILFMAVLGLRFCVRAFSSCGKWGATLHRGARASHCCGLLLRSTGSRCAGSVVVAHRLSCSTACGILPDQGSNPCPLHWQADSQPLHHQGSPGNFF